MAIDPPYRFDPWQNLVNVNWNKYHRYRYHYSWWYWIYWTSQTYYPGEGIWRGKFSAGGVWGTAEETYSDGCATARTFLESRFSTVHDLTINFSPDPQGFNSPEVIKAEFTYWVWVGYDEFLDPEDTGYIPEDQYITDPDQYSAPTFYTG